MTVEGLHIRRAEPDDHSAIYEMFSSPSVFPNTLRLSYPSREYWRRRLTELPESRYNLVAIMDFADNWVDLLRLKLEVFADNERAIRLYERFGFEVEGTLRQYAFCDRRYADVKLMARLRP
jgi:Acetyltransferase (GNAT) domain